MTHNLPRYRPSGYFRPIAIVLFLLVAVAGTQVACLYQGLINLIPFVYVNFLICAGFGVVLGAGGIWAVWTGHCRNRMIALLFALPVVALPLGASYFWDYRHFLTEVAMQDPGRTSEGVRQEIPFRRYLQIKQEAGWKVNHSTIAGGEVLAVWSVEALIILAIAMAMICSASGNPYCERCGRWADPRVLRIARLSRAQVEPLLSTRDLAAVIALQAPLQSDASTNLRPTGPLGSGIPEPGYLTVEGEVITINREGRKQPEPGTSTYLRLTGFLCDGCSDTGYLSIEEKVITIDKKGKRQEQTTRLVRYATMTTGQRAEFEARCGQPTA